MEGGYSRRVHADGRWRETGRQAVVGRGRGWRVEGREGVRICAHTPPTHPPARVTSPLAHRSDPIAAPHCFTLHLR